MNHSIKIKLLVFMSVIASILAPSGLVQASEIFEFYTGARQQAMGGAYTATVNDETAVLSNPAGLGRIRDTTFTIADPEIDASFTATQVATISTFTQVFTVQGLLDQLNQNKGVPWHAKVQFFPSFVAPNFGIGLHGKYQYDAEVDATGTNYQLDYLNDYALAMGFCLRFWGGIVKLGTTIRAVDRIEFHGVLPANSTGLEIKNIASEGLGVASDVGLVITLPVAWLPAIAGTIRDAGNTSYALSRGMFISSATRPVDTLQMIDAGFSISPILSNNNRLTITGEMHDVTNVREATTTNRNIHAGLEFNFHDFFFLRGGMNQGFYTAGIELASTKFQLQATTYGEDIGTDTTPREDRRFIGKFSIRF
ncbi:MAG: hypothetical protein AAB250_03900 [Bdellovibrionota bacterium]